MTLSSRQAEFVCSQDDWPRQIPAIAALPCGNINCDATAMTRTDLVRCMAPPSVSTVRQQIFRRTPYYSSIVPSDSSAGQAEPDSCNVQQEIYAVNSGSIRLLDSACAFARPPRNDVSAWLAAACGPGVLHTGEKSPDGTFDLPSHLLCGRASACAPGSPAAGDSMLRARASAAHPVAAAEIH